MPKPMLTDDYLIRMINQAIAVLLTIARMKESGQYQQAQQLIDQSLEQLIGLRINLIRSLDDQNILNTLTMNGTLDLNRLITVADLFKEDGDVLRAQEKVSASNWSYKRALYFYLKYENSVETDKHPDLDEKIIFLANILEGVYCQIESELLLSDYLERNEKYAHGYRVLEKLSKIQEYEEVALIQRIGYLERLTRKTDQKDLEGWMSQEKIIKEIAILQGKTG